MEFENVVHVTLLALCMCLLIEGDTHIANNQNDMAGREQELKAMLYAVKEQNRNLVLQIQGLQQVWLGMQQTCKALSVLTCACNQTDNVDSNVNSSNKTDVNKNENTNKSDNQTLQLKVLSIKSSGSISNVTKISITYSASPDHYVSWIGSRDDGRTWRKGGKMTQTIPGNEIYISTVDVEDLWSLRTMFFRLYNDEQSISIRLNTTAAETAQEQNIKAPDLNLVGVNTTYTTPQSSDLTIKAVINLNMTFIVEYSAADILLSGLNTSASPPAYFEQYGFRSGEAFNLNMSQRTKETTNCNITLSHRFIKYGAFLTIHVPNIESSKDRMIDEYSVGASIKIFAYGTKEVIPYNTVGTMPLQNQTLIFSPSISIACLAVGNPRPNATILKVDDNGGYMKLETETTYVDRYSQVEVCSLSAYERTNEARYICRASNGVKTVETFTEAVIVEEVVIDESGTGVMQNTTEIIIVSCKAKGKPRPEVDFRLYDEYGPFMVISGLFKFSKSTSGNYTSKVTLTLSPVDDVDVHTVYCHAAQGDMYRSIEKNHKINIFPESRENNWDLYYRVQDAQVFP